MEHFVACSSLSSLLNCQAGSAARFTCTSSSVRVSWSAIEIRAWRSAHEIERRRGKRDSDCSTSRSRFRSRPARNSLRSFAPPLTTRSVCTPHEGSISTHERNVANIASANLRKLFRWAVTLITLLFESRKKISLPRKKITKILQKFLWTSENFSLYFLSILD